MRRLWTVVGLIALLLVTAAMLGKAQGLPTGIFGRRDVQNHVLCYSAREGSDFLSCVYVPPDGTAVREQRLPGTNNPDPKTT